MSDDFDCAAYVNQQREKLRQRLRDPDFELFEKRFKVSVPPLLSQLYALGDALMNTPLDCDLGGGCLGIQSFTPMTDESIEMCRNYNWQYFEFAAGFDGDSLLYAMNDPDVVYVDHDGKGNDIEPTRVVFRQLLDQVTKTLLKERPDDHPK